MKIAHYIKVALLFSPATDIFYLALFHDTAEDGCLPKQVLKYWKALNALARRSGEKYFDCIARVKEQPNAGKVKFADPQENIKRTSPSLKRRHEKALIAIDYSTNLID